MPRTTNSPFFDVREADEYRVRIKTDDLMLIARGEYFCWRHVQEEEKMVRVETDFMF